MRSLAQATLNTGIPIKTAVADKGYRGHETWPGAKVILPGQRSSTSAERRWRPTRLRRRSVIEALIGHMKVDRLMDRNWLKGTAGDAMHATPYAAGQNLRLLTARHNKHDSSGPTKYRFFVLVGDDRAVFGRRVRPLVAWGVSCTIDPHRPAELSGPWTV